MSASGLVLALLVGLLALPAASAPSRSPPVVACTVEIGRERASSLARDCREAQPPAAAAICRPETPCQAMRDAIATACANPGSEAKPACQDFLEPEDDDEEDEE